jgi:hypothetical protein
VRVADTGERLSDLLEPIELAAHDGAFAIPLDALDYRWFRIGGLDYGAREQR